MAVNKRSCGNYLWNNRGKTLVGSATMAEDNNYWNLVTRNDGVTDDDGMYTFSLRLTKTETPPTGR